MRAELDHLVVWAPTLAAGCAWCQATLGVTPGPGGIHPLMGTHNRLLRLDGQSWPHAYLEIISLNPEQARAIPDRARWFDMDDPQLRQRILTEGPQLTHIVARVARLDVALNALSRVGIERGDALAATRETPQGPLEWRIAVRADGQRLFNGALPTLIEWAGRHPTETMPASGLRLQTLQLAPEGLAPEARARFADALACLGLAHWLASEPGAAAIEARFDGPRGGVTLRHSAELSSAVIHSPSPR